MRNLQEQVKKAFCYQKLLWPFTVWINCSSNLKNFANSWPSALNFKSFSRSLEQFFLTVGQNNFGNKVPLQCIVGIRLNLQMVFCCQNCSDLLCKKFVFYINVVCEWLARWSNLVLWNSPRRCFSFDLIRNLLCPYFSLELLIPEASWFFLPFLPTYFDSRHISIQTL